MNPAESSLRLFISSAPAAIAMLDRDMRYLAASERWLRDYGLRETDLTGLSHYTVFPEIPPAWREVHRRALAGESVRQPSEKFVRADGSEQWLRWEVRPWREPDGAIGGIVLYTEDLTEARRTALALAASEERQSALIESAIDAIVAADASGRIVMFNRAAETMFGWHREDVLGTPLDRLIPAVSRERHTADMNAFRSPVGRRMGARRNVVALRASGATFPIEASIATVQTAQGALHTAFVRDITVRLRTEQALASSQIELRELAVKANAAREMQHGRIARELHEQIARNLGALAADLDWLRGHCSDHRPETEEKFAHLRSIAADAMEATRRIAADLRPHILDDLGLVAAIEFQIHAFRRSAGVACGFSFEPPDLRLDEPYPTTVYRIIQEALANVAKHARAAAVTIGVRRDRHELLVSIKDDGRGFDPSAPRSVTSFGLAGMHERTLLLGGVFTVASAPGAGTTVEARIPLDPAGR